VLPSYLIANFIFDLGRQYRFWRVLHPDVDSAVRNLGLLLRLGHALRLFDGQALQVNIILFDVSKPFSAESYVFVLHHFFSEHLQQNIFFLQLWKNMLFSEMKLALKKYWEL